MKYVDMDAEDPLEEKDLVDAAQARRRLWIRLAVPFGLACLLFVIIVLPVYFDNIFLRVTVLVVLVVGLVLCVAGILQSKQCGIRNRHVCNMRTLGPSKLPPPEKY